MRRIASGVALHDTRMLVDPLRTQSRAVLVGALILVTGLAGCFIFSLIRPSGVAGNDAVLADRSTAALYVKLGDQLHPVLNLTSARLIAGRADNPTMVKTQRTRPVPPRQPARHPRRTGTHGAEHDSRCRLDGVRHRVGRLRRGDLDRRDAPPTVASVPPHCPHATLCSSRTRGGPGCCGTAGAAQSTSTTAQ